MNMKVIKNNEDYETALLDLGNLWKKRPEKGTIDFTNFEILVTLLEKYENERWPIAAPDPAEEIKFYMDQHD